MTDELVRNIILTDPDTGEVLHKFHPGIISDIKTTDDGYEMNIRHAPTKQTPTFGSDWLDTITALDKVPKESVITDAEGRQFIKLFDDPAAEQYFCLDGTPAWPHIAHLALPITHTPIEAGDDNGGEDWADRDCTLLGYGKGAICSACQYPPCHRPGEEA